MLGHAWIAHLAGGGSASFRTAVSAQGELTVALEVPPSSALLASSSDEAAVVTPASTSATRFVRIPVTATKRVAESASPALERSAGVADPNFYGARELDVYPALRSPLDLSAARGVVGRVELLLLVDESGRVQHVSAPGSGASDESVESLRRVFIAAAFTPALRAGLPVKSRLRVEVSADGQ